MWGFLHMMYLPNFQILEGVYYKGSYWDTPPPAGGVKNLSRLAAFSLWVYDAISNDHVIILNVYGTSYWAEEISQNAFLMYIQPYRPFTSKGHYNVIHGFDINGDFIMTDPAAMGRGVGFRYGWKEASNQANAAWVFAPLQEAYLE